MTTQEWKKAEESYGLYSPLKLIADGYAITLMKHISESKNKLFNIVYVNGEFKGIWLNNKTESPERDKFMYKKIITTRSYSEKELKRLRRIFGSEKAKCFEPTQYYSYSPYYPSFKSFKQRITKSCKDIDLVCECNEVLKDC